MSQHVTDHLANERTFLAWLRTAVAMMGFGILIVRLRELSPKATLVHGYLHAGQLGLIFAIIGLIMMPFALVHYLQARRAIDAERYYPAFWGIIIFTVAITGLGFIAVIYLLFSVVNNPPVMGLALSGN